MEILIPVLIVAALGLIAGAGLSLASKYMAVPVDERQEKIREALPGANCGACGYSGCDGYAEAIAKGEAQPDKCAPGGQTTLDALSEILGQALESNPKIAFIACGGNDERCTKKFDYEGLSSCTSASLMHSGALDCKFGCLGFGDCAAACPFGAISIIDGRPVVCSELCTGCGNCVAECPKSLISLIGKSQKILVNCSNKERGPAVVKSCKVSCIACRLCERSCEYGAIKVIDNIAVVDNELCTGCLKCKEACKRGVLI